MTIDEKIHNLNNKTLNLQIRMNNFLKEFTIKAKDLYQDVELLRMEILSLAKDEHNDS